MRMKNVFLPGIGIAALLAGSAVLPAGERTTNPVPDEVVALFKGHCAGCHKGVFAPKGLKLGPDALPASVRDVASREKPDLKLIDTAAPEASYILKKVRGAEGISGKRMPPPSKRALTAEELAVLENWILGLKATDAPAAEGVREHGPGEGPDPIPSPGQAARF